MPLASDGALSPVEAFKQRRRKMHDPAINGGMVDMDAALGHHLFNIAQAEIVGQVLSNAQQEHRTVEITAFEHGKRSV